MTSNNELKRKNNANPLIHLKNKSSPRPDITNEIIKYQRILLEKNNLLNYLKKVLNKWKKSISITIFKRTSTKLLTNESSERGSKFAHQDNSEKNEMQKVIC